MHRERKKTHTNMKNDILTYIAENDERIKNARMMHERMWGVQPELIVTVPGRTELSGNHTDHNNGIALAAAIDVDMLCAASTSEDMCVDLFSGESKRRTKVFLQRLDPVRQEIGSPGALIRGVARRLADKGYRIGGFCVNLHSNIIAGMGLSSSASFEVMTGLIISNLYNGGSIPLMDIAEAGKYAENVYFEKPCGMLDQLMCSLGGVQKFDFFDAENPVATQIFANLSEAHHTLLLVNTGSKHGNLISDYASVPMEMKRVASALGVGTLRMTSLDALLGNVSRIRTLCGDRAFTRAVHFFKECERVEAQANALERGDLERYLLLVRESGRSSFEYLQNAFQQGSSSIQPLAAALCICQHYGGDEAYCRIHGGGFAGMIQCYVPSEIEQGFRQRVSEVFGQDSVLKVKVRTFGGVRLDEFIYA